MTGFEIVLIIWAIAVILMAGIHGYAAGKEYCSKCGVRATEMDLDTYYIWSENGDLWTREGNARTRMRTTVHICKACQGEKGKKVDEKIKEKTCKKTLNWA